VCSAHRAMIHTCRPIRRAARLSRNRSRERPASWRRIAMLLASIILPVLRSFNCHAHDGSSRHSVACTRARLHSCTSGSLHISGPITKHKRGHPVSTTKREEGSVHSCTRAHLQLSVRCTFAPIQPKRRATCQTASGPVPDKQAAPRQGASRSAG